MPCVQCGQCCQTVSFPLPKSKDSIEWLEARGIACREVGGDTLIAEVPHRCSNLSVYSLKKECMLQGKKKPKACVIYPGSFEGKFAEESGGNPESFLAPGCGYKWDSKKKVFV